MWYYIKQSLMAFIYLFFMAITAFGIMCIGSDLVWLKVLLCLLNVALYVFIIGAAAFKDGQDALKVRIANDLEREQIIKTGAALPLKLKEEYKAWKGFVFGGIACAPLIILLIIHTLLFTLVGDNYIGAGAIAGFLYLMIFAFARLNVATTAEGAAVAAINPTVYYWTLLAIPVVVLSVGIPYVLGAKKIELQQARIKEKQRQIYGE